MPLHFCSLIKSTLPCNDTEGGLGKQFHAAFTFRFIGSQKKFKSSIWWHNKKFKESQSISENDTMKLKHVGYFSLSHAENHSIGQKTQEKLCLWWISLFYFTLSFQRENGNGKKKKWRKWEIQYHREVKILGFYYPLNVNLKRQAQHRDLSDLKIQLSEFLSLKETSSPVSKLNLLPNVINVFVFTSQNSVLNSSRYVRILWNPCANTSKAAKAKGMEFAG